MANVQFEQGYIQHFTPLADTCQLSQYLRSVWQKYLQTNKFQWKCCIESNMNSKKLIPSLQTVAVNCCCISSARWQQ